MAKLIAALLQVIGAVMVVVAVSMWSVPAALILSGLLVIGFGVGLERDA